MVQPLGDEERWNRNFANTISPSLIQLRLGVEKGGEAIFEVYGVAPYLYDVLPPRFGG